MKIRKAVFLFGRARELGRFFDFFDECVLCLPSCFPFVVLPKGMRRYLQLRVWPFQDLIIGCSSLLISSLSWSSGLFRRGENGIITGYFWFSWDGMRIYVQCTVLWFPLLPLDAFMRDRRHLLYYAG